MKVFTLLLGIALLAVFTWILIRNGKRTGFIHTLFRFDTLVGISASIYLIVSSLSSLLIH